MDLTTLKEEKLLPPQMLPSLQPIFQVVNLFYFFIKTNQLSQFQGKGQWL